MKKAWVCLVAMMLLSGCADPEVKPRKVVSKPKTPVVRTVTNPAEVLLVEADLTERPYQSLGDVEVVIDKTTIFNADPEHKLINERLREKAARLGADAVILVRYNETGVSLKSWGKFEGKGHAVAFKEKGAKK